MISIILTITFLLFSYNEVMPRVSYIKAMDVYLGEIFLLVLVGNVGSMGRRDDASQAQPIAAPSEQTPVNQVADTVHGEVLRLLRDRPTSRIPDLSRSLHINFLSLNSHFLAQKEFMNIALHTLYSVVLHR